jgi:hypothetical protein
MLKQSKTFSEFESARSTDLRGVSLGLRRKILSQSGAVNENLPVSQVIQFLLLHVPLLILFRAAPFVATIHSLATLGFGLFCLMHDKHPRRAACVIAYIAGAEILWRGVEAAIVWEYGKYATLLLCILMILKFRLLAKSTQWPWMLVILLVPGILVAPAFDREALSFQLAGLVTLGMMSLVFSTLEFNRKDLQQFFLMPIAPGIALTAFMASNMATHNIVFSAGSNAIITGEMGANQIASSLSFAAMTAFFNIFLIKHNPNMQRLMIVLVLVLLTMSVLTFSRGGLWNTAVAVLSALPILVRGRQQRFRVLGAVFILGLLGYFVILPQINNYTSGALLRRFSDFDSTGRDVLVQIDLRLFQANPIWGVGVGQSVFFHPVDSYGFILESHTEYGRLLAEHGIFGALIIVLLLSVTIYRLFSQKSSFSKAISTSFSIWALFYMLHSATRTVAPSVAFGLAAARFLTDENEKSDA